MQNVHLYSTSSPKPLNQIKFIVTYLSLSSYISDVRVTETGTDSKQNFCTYTDARIVWRIVVKEFWRQTASPQAASLPNCPFPWGDPGPNLRPYSIWPNQYSDSLVNPDLASLAKRMVWIRGRGPAWRHCGLFTLVMSVWRHSTAKHFRFR